MKIGKHDYQPLKSAVLCLATSVPAAVIAGVLFASTGQQLFGWLFAANAFAGAFVLGGEFARMMWQPLAESNLKLAREVLEENRRLINRQVQSLSGTGVMKW